MERDDYGSAARRSWGVDRWSSERINVCPAVAARLVSTCLVTAVPADVCASTAYLGCFCLRPRAAEDGTLVQRSMEPEYLLHT